MNGQLGVHELWHFVDHLTLLRSEVVGLVQHVSNLLRGLVLQTIGHRISAEVNERMNDEIVTQVRSTNQVIDAQTLSQTKNVFLVVALKC